jgi:hypothetical protein
VKSYGVYHSKAKKLRKWLLKEFEKDVKYKSILDSLDNLATSVPETSEEIMVF